MNYIPKLPTQVIENKIKSQLGSSGNRATNIRCLISIVCRPLKKKKCRPQFECCSSNTFYLVNIVFWYGQCVQCVSIGAVLISVACICFELLVCLSQLLWNTIFIFEHLNYSFSRIVCKQAFFLNRAIH